MIGSPNLMRPKKPGDPIRAEEWNELVRLATRQVQGDNVIADDTGWVMLPAPRKSAMRLAQVVCEGPNGEDNPTNECYWIQFVDVLEGNPSNPEEPIEVDTDNHEIVLATNIAEINTHTHGVRTGTVVEAWQARDIHGANRWVFTFLPALFVILLGGMFNAYGEQRARNFALWATDKWSEDTIVPDLHEAGQGIGYLHDVAWYAGTWWIAGNIDDGVNGYCFAYYDWDTSDWVPFLIGAAGEYGGVGHALYVWDDGVHGERLYCAQLGGSGSAPVALTDVRAVTFDPATKTLTVYDIGWRTANGPDADVWDMLAHDDGSGEKLFLIGYYGATGTYTHIVTYDGSSFAGVGGGCGDATADRLYAICEHDFGDGNGVVLVVGGRFSQIGTLTTSQNVAEWEGSDRIAVGGGVKVGTTSAVFSLASFNARLWLVKGSTSDPLVGDYGNFKVLPNGPPRKWLNAKDVIKDLDETPMSTSGLWTYKWTGSSNTPMSAALHCLRVYRNHLVVSGGMSWRTYRRDLKASGPLASYNTTDDAWDPATPMVRGDIRGLSAWNGGVACAGKFRRALPGGGVVRNFAVWYDNGPDDMGRWESLGDFVGVPTCSAVFNGDLYVGGDISSAGGVPVKGLARYDAENETWVYVANFSDYGTIRALLVAGDKLVIMGDFIKVDGQAQYKIACTWDGYRLGTIFSDIDAPDGYPELRAGVVLGSYLYVVGWFDSIDGSVTARCVARRHLTTGVWSALPDSGGLPDEGINNSRMAYSIGHLDGVIWIGTDPDAKCGSSSSEAGLWTWDPSSPQWSVGLLAVWDGPTIAITQNSDGTKLWAATETHQYFGADPWGGRYRVYEFGGSSTTLLGSTSNGTFEAPVRALLYSDAGDGAKLRAGGDFNSVGDIGADTSRGCNRVVAVSEDDRLVDMAGGLGIATYTAQFSDPQIVQRMRVAQIPGHRCEVLACVGAIDRMNDGYSEYVVGVDLRGKLRGVQGGLSGSYRADLPGRTDGVSAIDFITDPEAWGRTVCDHDLGFWYLLFGSFSHAVNNHITDLDRDLGVIEEDIECYGVVAFDGHYFRRVVAAGRGGYNEAGAYYDETIIAGGGAYGVQAYSGTPASGSWDHLQNPTTTGALWPDTSTIYRLLVFGSDLWVSGALKFYPGTSGPNYAIAKWNGSSYTPETPVGYSTDPDIHIDDMCIADIGSGEQLIACGLPVLSTDNPVVKRSSAGVWSIVGGATLRGWAKGIGAVAYPAGTRLFVTGELQVLVGAAWVDTDVAMLDPAVGAWESIGYLGWLDVADRGALEGDCHGYGPRGGDMMRMLIGGLIGEVATNAVDIGTTNAIWAPGMAQWQPSPELWRTFRPNAGVNGIIQSIRSAGRLIWPPTA